MEKEGFSLEKATWVEGEIFKIMRVQADGF